MSTMETIVALWRWLCGWGVSAVVIGLLIHDGYAEGFKKYRTPKGIKRDKKALIIYVVLIVIAVIASLFLNGIFI